MAIGEVFIGAFITVLFEKLASGDLIGLARSAGIHPELNKLRKNLALIRAVLADAGEKHIRDRSVQLWLNELQHLAYEIDDVLDELATEAMRRQLNKESYANASTSTSTKLKFIPSKLHAIKYGLKMRSKLEGIATKLRELVEEKNLLGLEDDAERPKRGSRRSEETSLLPIVVIVGNRTCESQPQEQNQFALGISDGTFHFSYFNNLMADGGCHHLLDNLDGYGSNGSESSTGRQTTCGSAKAHLIVGLVVPFDRLLWM